MEKQMKDLKKKMSNCFITKDYKLFTKTKGNRPINLAHVEKIKKAIARKDLKLPKLTNTICLFKKLFVYLLNKLG